MLAANLPVCQYAGMPVQTNSSAGSNHNNNSNTSTNNANNNISCNNNTNTTNNSNSSNTNIISNVIHPNTTNSSNGNVSPGNRGNDGNLHIGLVGGGTSAAAAKNQLEQLNTMREALFSQDGWGCQHVNQDTNWEVPGSPEPTNKDSTGPPLWKPIVNNGTDLWESNLRNGGQPTTQPLQKSWGHTPSTNLGGTWGEDDDGGPEVTNVWTVGNSNCNPSSMCVAMGATSAAVSGVTVPPSTSQWGQSNMGGGPGVGVSTTHAGPSIASGNTNTNGINVPGTPNLGAGVGASCNNWGELRSGPLGMPLDIRNVDSRDCLRAPSAGDSRDMRMLDPRDPIRGDPRGISGRLNGTSEMWGQHHPISHNQMQTMNKVGAAVSGNINGAVVSGAGSVTTIGGGLGGVGVVNPSSGVCSNIIGSQWSMTQSVAGQKDLTSITTKSSNSGWEEPSPPPQRRNLPNYDDGTSVWSQQSRIPGVGSHWKDVSDPRNHHMRGGIGASGQNLTPMSNAAIIAGLNISSGSGNNAGLVPSIVASNNPNNSMNLGPGGRLISNVGGSGVMGSTAHKTDNIAWAHPGGLSLPNVVASRNQVANWVSDENSHNVVVGVSSNSSNWVVDDKTNAQGTSGIGQISATTWNDPPSTSWNKPQTHKLSGVTTSWSVSPSTVTTGTNEVNDLNSIDWGNGTSAHNTIIGKPQQTKLNSGVINMTALSQELKQSKQFRILVEAGFKKDDVERALLSTNMNIEEATELLRASISIGIDSWRRHGETLSSFADHSSAAANNNFPGRYANQTTQSIISFPPNNVINTTSGGMSAGSNQNLNVLTNIQPLQMQKYLPQGGSHGLSIGGLQSANATSQQCNNNATVVTNNSNQPSTQQLRMLVQQIQLAVHNGYLSSQILNQPLAPTTLLLLNQLLSNIKHLQGAQQSLRGGNNTNTMVAIAKYKQQIQNLQNQINAQQAIYIKQQQQQNLQQTPQHPSSHISNNSAEYLRSHDALITIHNNFSEMSLNKSSGSAGFHGNATPQSRLNQWKLPTIDKDTTVDSTDFSRAPGTSKQGGLPPSSSNVGPLGIQSDGTWSTICSINDGWPETLTEGENKDWSVSGHPSTAAAYTDLVQEFEPGKPWKGTQIRSIEDDPSITPGSVARSPLSINSTAKDGDIFANPTTKASPSDVPSINLSTSSTWSFNPPSNNQIFSSWSDNSQQELWTSTNKSCRGPPPGLAANKPVSVVASISNSSSIMGGNSNGWLSTRSTGGWSGTNSTWNSNWLLLKNLTTQIDSSTLRTLCMQHGPLLRFHLYLSQGIALCKYATREEASKAQITLNNCFLGNTTICAESPGENEVESLLHHLSQSNKTITTSTSGNGAVVSQTSSSIGSNNNGHSDITSSNVIISSSGNGNGASNNNSNSANNCSAGTVTNGTTNVAANKQSSPVQTINVNGNNIGISNCGPTVASHNPNINTGPTNPTSSNNVNAGPSWRQQLQNTTNQSRTSGRDDFEFISQYVCSIVDD